MSNDRLPLLRGYIRGWEPFRSVTGGERQAPALPPQDPKQHRDKLIRQLDVLELAVHSRTPDQRDPEAQREIIAVQPEAGFSLPAEKFESVREDARVVSVDEKTNVVLLDVANPGVPYLRDKIEQFADDTKLTQSGGRKNAPAIAPIHEFRLPSDFDFSGERLRTANLGLTDVRWFEVGCRGGTRRPREEAANSRAQMFRQLSKFGLGHVAPQEFLATEQLILFVRLSLAQLRQIIEAVDCIYEFDLASPDVRDWRLLSDQPAKDLRKFQLSPPEQAAPSIVLLDSGVSLGHPMLEAAVLSSASVVPNVSATDDAAGHGTQMAGIALYEDVGGVVEAGKATAPYWLQSVRILVKPGTGTSDDASRQYWPAMTKAAVDAAEHPSYGVRPRVYAMAVSASLEPISATPWSHAIDQLAYNEGQGRLFCVSIGNAESDDVQLLKDYPTMQLQQRLEDPSQAANALTIGAYTDKVVMPPDKKYAESRPVAPSGGISPHTRAGFIGAEGPIKPDVVLEGGNVAFDGSLPDGSVETLVSLTTGRNHISRPLSSICQTSEATARAARLAAAIWKAEPSLRPETVRGLIVHSASWTPKMKAQFQDVGERMAVAGYGVPDEAFALSCATDRATIVVEDSLPNGVPVVQPKKVPPKRVDTNPNEIKLKRPVKFFRLPVPENILLDNPDTLVELRITLSYFPEPNTFRRRVSYGLDLKWDMQGPFESEPEFRQRINALQRKQGEQYKTRSFPWTIGISRRSRGTVQSDRWDGRASWLAGNKLIAVYPVLGWWDQRNLQDASQPFSLIVSVRTSGLAIYDQIAQQLQLDTAVEAPWADIEV